MSLYSSGPIKCQGFFVQEIEFNGIVSPCELVPHSNALHVTRAGRIDRLPSLIFIGQHTIYGQNHVICGLAYDRKCQCKCVIDCNFMHLPNTMHPKHNCSWNNCKNAPHILGTNFNWFIVHLTLQQKNEQWKSRWRWFTIIKKSLFREVIISKW